MGNILIIDNIVTNLMSLCIRYLYGAIPMITDPLGEVDTELTPPLCPFSLPNDGQKESNVTRPKKKPYVSAKC